jgi:Glycine cleavage system protein P (pyridoxal-binding), N-terminal domain
MDLTGLEVSNASLLDEGTSAVEAMLLAFRSCKESKNIFLVSEFCHPQTVDLLITRGRPLGISVIVGDLDSLFATHSNNFFGFIAQYPNTLGEVKDFEFLINHSKSQGAISILATDLLSLILLKTPGEMGADIAVGSSQRFGVPLGFGGPHAAFIACKDQFKRLLPGRIIGRSIDKNSEVAYRMALQTREQHIRREKATSNICTAQSLLAITAAAYAMYHGPIGLKEISLRVHRYTRLLAKALENAGFQILYKSFFDTISIKTTSLKIANIKKKSLGKQINFKYYSKEIVSLSLDETPSLNDLYEILSCFVSIKNFEF